MQKKLINNNWQFLFGQNVGIENITISDLPFANIGLPHTFTLPYFGLADFYIGYGVYKKIIDIDADDIGKVVMLEFGGVFQHCEIFVNGLLAGSHNGGYTAFIVDISSFIRPHKNQILVRVDNFWDAKMSPRAGEHTFSGGIYRDVSLIIAPTSHIDWCGVFINTANVTATNADITISAETSNANDLQILHTIIDKNGNIVATTCGLVKDNYSSVTLHLDNINLWTLKDAYLYTVKSQIADDISVDTFGIRYFQFNNTTGFSFNGNHLDIEGANVHQDRGGWGDASTHSQIARDIALVRGCGFNLIRGSHYPHHSIFADECDKQGILFWSECTFWGIGGFRKDGYWDCSAYPINPEDEADFEKHCLTTLAEMIKTNRNHPSIITWSMGNEIFFIPKNLIPKAKNLVKKMVELAHSLDNSRPASVGGVQREGFHELGDLAGFNGDGAVLFKKTRLPNIVAEYGSIVSLRPGKYQLHYTDGTEKLFPWRSGRVLWCAFHHGSIANIGNMGIIDLYRLPLRAWYAYREKLLNIPPITFPQKGIPHHLDIELDKTSISTDGTDDCRIIVRLFNKENLPISNTTDIILSIISGAGLFPTGSIYKMSSENGTFLDGAGAIDMRAYYSGKIDVCVSSIGLPSINFTINAMGEYPFNGENIQLPITPQSYKHFTKDKVDLILNRPLKVSSEWQNNTRNNATNGDIANYWQPSAQDIHPYVKIDMENIYQPNLIIITLAKPCKLKLMVNISKDDISYKTVYRMLFYKKTNIISIPIKKHQGRYLNIAFKLGKESIMVQSINVF